MKAKLIFDLENPDDIISHSRCVKALDMASVLFEITTNLKKKCEYVCENMSDDCDQFDGVELVFSEIYRLLDENNINIDELIQ